MSEQELNKIIAEEGDFEKFEHAGLNCQIVRQPRGNHWCGYVEVPKESWLFNKHYYFSANSENSLSDREKALNNIEVHGGLTFSGKMKDFDYCFGFDCAHLGDLLPIDFMIGTFPNGGDVYRDKGYVTDETKSLADQIAKIV